MENCTYNDDSSCGSPNCHLLRPVLLNKGQFLPQQYRCTPQRPGNEPAALVEMAADSRSGFGTLEDEHMRYLYENQDGEFTRYVFTDIYQEQQSLYWQLIHSFLICAFTLAVFFVLANYLSRWSVRPVAEAWEHQRQFAADASHELKTPLTVILSNAGMLLQSSDLPEGKQRRRIEDIHAEAVRMKQLTEALLTLAKSDTAQTAAQTTVNHTPLDFSFLVSSTLLSFESLAFETGKEIVCDAQSDIMVMGDENRLRQLLAILLDNACKYGRSGSAITVRLYTDKAKEALLTITSEGTPLSTKEMEHLFLRFYRADPARSSVPGYGLGLSIGQNIAAEHKGKIEVTTDGIKENRFTVRLQSLCC